METPKGTGDAPMKIVGRDNILATTVYPRVKEKRGLLITGQRGMGKSVILNWAYEKYDGPKCQISARQPYGQILREIGKELKVDGLSRHRVHEVEKEIIKTGNNVGLFIDDIEAATPRLMMFLKAVAGRWQLYMSGNEPFRDEMKPILWGKTKVEIEAVSREERQKLAEQVIRETGSLVPPQEIAQQSRGNPGRAWAIARGEANVKDEQTTRTEEINIAPIFLIGIAGFIVLRYIGIGMGEKDIYLIGGIGMGAATIVRYMVMRSARRE